ncbi:MAG: outer membrane lipoprotein carrier protein LolA [Polyangiaceae bacterium]|nr:outer membrane lipoprotein carrier protein LolA [Polyangiaceae bacterium]
MKAFAVTRRTFLAQSSYVFAALAASAVVLSPREAAAAPTAEEVAKNVQKFYDTTKTFRAGFKQVYFIKVQNKKKESKGKVVFEKPGKMSFTYDEPNGNRVVSDGKIIKVYEKESEQMYETVVSKSQYPAALAFLMGEGKLEKDFKLKLLDSATMKFEGGHVLEGTPKDASPAYEKMLLYVDGPTSQVRRVVIIDAQSNRNRFDFSDPVLNKPVEAKEFDFKPPPGTKIIKP